MNNELMPVVVILVYIFERITTAARVAVNCKLRFTIDILSRVNFSE